MTTVCIHPARYRLGKRANNMQQLSEAGLIALAGTAGAATMKLLDLVMAALKTRSDRATQSTQYYLAHGKELLESDSDRIEKYTARMDAQDARIDALNSSIGTLNASLLEERRLNNDLVIRVADLEKRNSELVRINDQLRQENAELKVVNGELRAQVRDRLQTAVAVHEEVEEMRHAVEGLVTREQHHGEEIAGE